ncbi:hypothetical protein H0H92_013345 [Tricholoma furcatifolium]|nr:hypothetical protein H0H92_013345 [Tricholoma furcatifolium]
MVDVYNGHLVLRFERSQLPEHAKSRVFVLRVLKILQSGVANGSEVIHSPFIKVKEGELLERRKRGGWSSRVYTMNLDPVDGGAVSDDHKDLGIFLLDSDSKVHDETTPPPLDRGTHAAS